MSLRNEVDFLSAYFVMALIYRAIITLYHPEEGVRREFT